ncbi:MAG: amidohydrolase family protein, partial [Proteobacteria bacterium]|nr:amidohydrolase family protein [Pseudomonadota bacterium]
FADMDAWFDLLKSVEFGSNVFHLAPHGTIRQEMFGENQPGELNQQQMEAMKNRVREEMEKGAVGFSTGLEYAPGLQASIGELVELNKVVREYGRIYTTHMRTESGAADADGVTGFENSFRETMAVVRQAEVPVEISHLKITAPINDQKASLVLDLIEKARTEGLKVTADQYPYDAGSTNLAIFLPAHFKSDTGIKNELKTREGRVQIKKAIEAVFSHLGPEKLLLTMYPEKRFYEGKTVAEISEMEGKSPTDVYADMVCEKRAPIGVFFTQDMDIVRELMPNDFVITGSDGWTVPKGLTVPHPRTYGTFPRKIEKFALKEQLISLVQAIHSMTGLPAETFNMKGRGKIAAGNYADVAVIDIDAIADRSTYLDPHHYAEGVVHLLVNGRFGIENGKDTGIEAGKALRM